MTLLQRIATFTNNHQLMPDGSLLIVGVSGGGDSVALLHILLKLNYKCIVAHCNFQLRGTESDGDTRFVKNLSEEWGVPFVGACFDTKTVAKKQGISIEMAARRLRYDWFETIREMHHADYIAVAHHLDDAVETFFNNLSRGCGLRGLTGIKVKQGYVVRPLLDITQKDICNYLIENNLDFRTDSSNDDQAIIRNKIRHAIIPLFLEINPSFRETMSENMRRFKQYQNLIDMEIAEKEKTVVTPHGATFDIDIEGLKRTPDPALYLYELLRPCHFNAATIEDIIQNLDRTSGKQFFSPTHRLIKDRRVLIVHPVEKQQQQDIQYITIGRDVRQIDEPVTIRISEPQPVDAVMIIPSPDYAFLDADTLTFPLTLRHPKEGDMFMPFGKSMMRKLLSDFFIDLKWSRLQKEECWLLTSEENIVWIVGTRIDKRFSITPDTKSVICMQVVKYPCVDKHQAE